MLAELKFVQGAVAKKDFVPELKHFAIGNGRVRGFNGTLALCSPIALDITCKPLASSLVAAIANCNDTVQMSLTAKGRLSVKSGAFKALIECVQEDTLHVEPEGERIELDGVALLAGFKAVWPFIGDDASRPWSNGVLLHGQSCYATNNVTLVQYWVGSAFPHVVNIPRAAIREMIRINEAPTHAQMVEGNNITFHYSNSRWVRTQLFVTDWPDAVFKILDTPCNPVPVDPRLFTGLKTIKPFIDKLGRVYFYAGGISTHVETEEGATYEIPDQQDEGIYSYEMLTLLDGVAQTVDFSLYPKPCMFYGERLRGTIIGMRQ